MLFKLHFFLWTEFKKKQILTIPDVLLRLSSAERKSGLLESIMINACISDILQMWIFSGYRRNPYSDLDCANRQKSVTHLWSVHHVGLCVKALQVSAAAWWLVQWSSSAAWRSVYERSDDVTWCHPSFQFRFILNGLFALNRAAFTCRLLVEVIGL